ncbi:hypothetical protein D3C87_1390360 [compost metagenome]
MADGDIHPLADEIDRIVGQRDIQLDIRKELQKFAGHRQDVEFTKTDRGIDRQRTARQCPPAAGNDLFRIGDLGEDARGARQIGFAFRRQLQQAGGTHDEPRTQPVFQTGDELADCRG